MRRLVAIFAALMVVGVGYAQVRDRLGVSDIRQGGSWVRMYSSGATDTIYGATPVNVKGYPFLAVGDGSTDDMEAIQAAVDSVVAWGGGAIYFPPGTYKVSDSIEVTGDNISFVGDGIVNTKVGWFDGDGAGGDGSNGSYIFDLDGATNIGFYSMSLTNGPSEDLGATNTPNAGGIISAEDCVGITLRDCYLYEIGGTHGFVIERCSDVAVENTGFYMISYSGMIVRDTCKNITVRGCKFSTVNSEDTGYNRYLFATGADELLSADTTNAYFCKDVLIAGNTFENNTVWEGIDLHGGDNVRIVDNVVRNCYVGILATCATSGGNEYVTSPGLNNLVIKNNVVDADTLSTVKAGILVRGHDGGATVTPWHCDGAIIDGNSVTGYGGMTADNIGAITIYRLANAKVYNNIVKDFAQAGLMLYAYIDGVDVFANTFRGAGDTHQFDDRVAAISVRSPQIDGAKIYNNRFVDDDGEWDHAIYEWTGCNGAEVFVENNTYLDRSDAWGTFAVRTNVGPLNVMDFGATGDGVTDDLAAIQSAIAIAQADSGSVVFPPGTYRCTDVLVVSGDVVSLIGHGGAQILAAHDTVAVRIGTTTRATHGILVDGLRLRRATLDTTKTSSVGFELFNVSNSQFNNYAVENFKYGVVLDASSTYSTTGNVFSSGRHLGCQYSVHIDNPNNDTALIAGNTFFGGAYNTSQYGRCITVEWDGSGLAPRANTFYGPSCTGSTTEYTAIISGRANSIIDMRNATNGRKIALDANSDVCAVVRGFDVTTALVTDNGDSNFVDQIGD